MLRRVLVPFSELFILLMVMFFALFFVSASLGGREEDRPVDDLFMMSLSLKSAAPTPDNAVTPPWLTGAPLFVALTDQESLSAGEWRSTWLGMGMMSNELEWGSLLFDGKCHRRSEVTSGNLYQYSLEKRDPSQALRARGFKKSFPEMTAGFDSVRSQIDFPSYLQPIWPIDTVGATYEIAYRPSDLDRTLILQSVAISTSVGLLQASKEQEILAFFPNQTLTVKSSSIEKLKNNVSNVSVGCAVQLGAESRKHACEWIVNDHVQEQPPFYFIDNNCSVLPTIRLFVTLSPNGVAATPFDPRLDL